MGKKAQRRRGWQSVRPGGLGSQPATHQPGQVYWRSANDQAEERAGIVASMRPQIGRWLSHVPEGTEIAVVEGEYSVRVEAGELPPMSFGGGFSAEEVRREIEVIRREQIGPGRLPEGV